MAGGCWAGERMAAVILCQQRAGHAGLQLPASLVHTSAPTLQPGHR